MTGQFAHDALRDKTGEATNKLFVGQRDPLVVINSKQDLGQIDGIGFRVTFDCLPDALVKVHIHLFR